MACSKDSQQSNLRHQSRIMKTRTFPLLVTDSLESKSASRRTMPQFTHVKAT